MTPLSVPPRRALLILGMHRSGTSAVTRVLNLCGAVLPENVLRPNEANRSGYWEPTLLVDFHERWLQSVGSRWDDPAEFPTAWFQSDPARVAIAELVAILEREYADAPLLVVKDPRICRLLPLWLQALTELRIEPICLLPVRHPLEVVGSLQQRDGMTAAQGQLLWLQHVLAAEADSRGLSRLVFTFEQLLQDWSSVLARLEQHLGLVLPLRGPQVNAEVEAFLDPGQRRQRVESQRLQTRQDVSPWVRQVYEWLQAAARDESPDPRALDEVRQELRRAEVLYTPYLTEDYRLGLQWRQEREQACQERDQLQQERDHLQQERDHLQRELAAALSSAEAQVREVLTQAETQLQGVLAEAAQLQQQLARLQAQVNYMESSRFWKLRERLRRLRAKLRLRP